MSLLFLLMTKLKEVDKRKQPSDIEVDYSILVNRQSHLIPSTNLMGSYSNWEGSDSSSQNRNSNNSSSMSSLLSEYLGDCSTEAILNGTQHDQISLQPSWYTDESNEHTQVRMSEIGIQRNYATVRRRVAREEIRKVWCNFLTDFAALSAFIYVLMVGATITQNSKIQE